MATAHKCRRDPVCEVDRKLRRIARHRRELDRLTAAQKAKVRSVKRRYARPLRRHRRMLRRLSAELERFCDGNRSRIIPSARKSVRTALGRVGYRKTPARVVLRRGHTKETACRALESDGLGHLVRMKRSPDRRAIKRAVVRGSLSRARLRRAGLAISGPHEKFYFRFHESELSQGRDHT